jgi:DNA replication protein DnaC
MWGDAGIGKSHMAVSLAKRYMQQGLEPRFIVANEFSFSTQLDLDAGQVWIVDDCNSGYGLASLLYKRVIRSVHDRGGRVFVTSNKPHEQLMHEMFVGDGEAERMRYEDRTKGMLKILHVTGESVRQQTAWYNDEGD